MKGQFFGGILDKENTRQGAFWMHIDNDQTAGYALYRDMASRHITRVAGVSISIGLEGRPIYLVRSDAVLESAFRIPSENQLPAAFSASLQVETINEKQPYQCTGVWNSGETNGNFEMIRAGEELETSAQQVFTDWDAFKLWANKYSSSPGHAFRGQGARHRLKTSFHRTGRVDLIRYIRKDLPVFVDHIETLTGMRYTLENPSDFGSILGIAQHHGFPTPLLDWTYSPYVAAYFAFAEIVANPNPPSHVRLFRLEPGFVQEGVNKVQIDTLDVSISVATYRPPSRGNGRLLNQQGLFVFSNAVDIESQLRKIEIERHQNPGAVLEIVDISSDQARRALADLKNMGTTSATLFPGLDGVASFLKHSLFFAPLN